MNFKVMVFLFLIIFSLTSCSPSVLNPTTTNQASLTPNPTPTLKTMITPTPIPWQRYNIRFGAQLIPSLITNEAWIPIPRDWDDNGMRNVEIIDLNPEPANIIFDESGTKIAHWIFENDELQTIEVVFEVDLAIINQQIINPSDIKPYDISSEIFSTYTAPEPVVQSDNQKIIDTANRIVGTETNPYRQARLLYNWVFKNLIPEDEPSIFDDALSSLEAGIGECSNHSNLLVALARSIGIPARNIAGIPYLSSFENNSSAGHVWVELFFLEIGWVQVDPSLPDSFGKINDIRLILSKGNSINNGRTDCYLNGERSWFHTPEGYYCGGLGPSELLWIKIDPIN